MDFMNGDLGPPTPSTIRILSNLSLAPDIENYQLKWQAQLVNLLSATQLA